MERCVMCGTDEKPFLSPVKCIIRNGLERSHKICQECWFKDFAKEEIHHACPGCEKNMPLQYHE
jgi:hypothetical protein